MNNCVILYNRKGNEFVIKLLKRGTTMKIANLTMHSATPEMVEWGIRQGDRADIINGLNSHNSNGEVEFSDPMGIEVPVWWDGFAVRETAGNLIARVKELEYTNIMVGGLTDLTYHEIGYAISSGITVYTALTERVRDENDRFVFVFKGLRKIWRNEEVFYE
jgi:hypothetical protein